MTKFEMMCNEYGLQDYKEPCKERNISGSKVTMSLRVLATVSSGNFEHLGMGFVVAGEASTAWPFATRDELHDE